MYCFDIVFPPKNAKFSLQYYMQDLISRQNDIRNFFSYNIECF